MKPLNGDSIAFFLAHRWPVGVSAHGHCGHGEAHRCCSAALPRRRQTSSRRDADASLNLFRLRCYCFATRITTRCYNFVHSPYSSNSRSIYWSSFNQCTQRRRHQPFYFQYWTRGSKFVLFGYLSRINTGTHTHTESSLTTHFNDKFISKVSLCFWLSFYILR